MDGGAGLQRTFIPSPDDLTHPYLSLERRPTIARAVKLESKVPSVSPTRLDMLQTTDFGAILKSSNIVDLDRIY